MNTCTTCGTPFRPQSAAWGDHTCGNCIADCIAFELARPFLRAERKPLKRAAGTPDAQPIVAEAEQRRA